MIAHSLCSDARLAIRRVAESDMPPLQRASALTELIDECERLRDLAIDEQCDQWNKVNEKPIQNRNITCQ